VKPDEQPLISLQTGPTVPVVKAIQELKAANDNVVSETAALRAQLKAANDNYQVLKSANDVQDKELGELRDEMERMKRVGAGK
jgi:hypothetical protein